MGKFLHITFFVLFFISGAFADETLHVRSSKYFEIYSSKHDSVFVDYIISYLPNKYEEIAFDLGLDDLKPVNIIISPNFQHFNDLVFSKLPHWTEAYAQPSQNRMVIKSPRWALKKESPNFTLVHELLHVLLHQKLGDVYLPRWMDEGLAILYSDEKTWQTSTAISKALTTNSLIPLGQIDNVLNFHNSKAQLAYQQSYSAVRYLLSIYDIEVVLSIIEKLSNGSRFNQAFYESTGLSFYQFEKEWGEYVRKNQRWYWLKDIDEFIWPGLILIMVFTWFYKKRQAKKKLEQWDIEERNQEFLDSL